MIELGKHHELFSYIITSDSKLSFTTQGGGFIAVSKSLLYLRPL